jgi:SAM-dependent methyltransferase
MAQARSMSSPSSYVHGYGGHERARLQDQAGALLELLHADVAYPPGSTVLEVGCGVGAQTVTLAARSPGARITSFDLSVASLLTVRRRLGAAAHDVALLQADLFRPPFAPASFDHLFVCFVLEHLPRPLAALRALGEMLRPGGTMTVVEGDHGSVCFHPDSPAARAAIDCQVQLQRAAGGDACIGRRLYPLLRAADLDDVRVTPLLVYADASRPDLVDAFTLRTFTAMIEGVREAALAANLLPAHRFDAGTRALHRTADEDGVFCYTFFKGRGRRPAP